MESRKCNYQKELDRQDLILFAEKLFHVYKKASGKDLMDVVGFGDYLIALGLCPGMDFLYKVNKGLNL